MAPVERPDAGTTSSARTRSHPRRIANGRFEIRKALGAGCFGKVYRAINTETCQEVAVKFELPSGGGDVLAHEAKMLDILRSEGQPHPQGFAKHYYFGREGPCRLLVMEFLGRSLEDSLQACGGSFDVTTCVLIAGQLVRRLEYLHSRGLVHQDIKPENFVWGLKERQHHLYLIDFGLSKQYYHRRHCRMQQHHGLIGTARYASINAHRGLEQSRRDDLEAVGHMLFRLLRGSLPWTGLVAQSAAAKLNKIRQIKEHYPVSELGRGFPRQFVTYLNYSRSLGFKERPDYVTLRGHFAEARTNVAGAQGSPVEDHDFQWNRGLELRHLTPLESWTPLQQPDDLELTDRLMHGLRCLGARGCQKEALKKVHNPEPKELLDATRTTPAAAARAGGA